jgi:general L-amino acid transport system ATP-binding protein
MIAEVPDVMMTLAQEDMNLVCITHEMGFARKLAVGVIVMEHGEIVAEAPPGQFFTAPQNDRTGAFLSHVRRHGGGPGKYILSFRCFSCPLQCRPSARLWRG